jgi:ATP synthase protein I
LGRQAGGSFAVGGLICVVPNIYLYSRVFAHFGARQAKNIIKAFYWGEAVKLILTGCGFAGAFILIPWIKPPWLFSGYIAAQLGFWLAPIVLGFLLGKTAR